MKNDLCVTTPARENLDDPERQTLSRTNTSATKSQAPTQALGHKHGGGPRTPSGKAASSRNARKHGILSPSPVAGGESQEDWEAFLGSMQERHPPFDLYEEEIVSHIADEFWSLRRITRQIRDLIDLRTNAIDPPRPISFIKSIEHGTSWSAYTRPLEAACALPRLDAHSESYDFGEEVVDDCRRAVFATGPDFEFPDSGSESVPYGTAGYLRRFVAVAAEARGLSEATVISEAVALLYDVVARALYAEDRFKEWRTAQADLAERAARAHLPSESDYDTLIRYKRSHERSLRGWLEMLEDAQRARAGSLPAPIRVQGLEG
jgi:hypothetical protein